MAYTINLPVGRNDNSRIPFISGEEYSAPRSATKNTAGGCSQKTKNYRIDLQENHVLQVWIDVPKQAYLRHNARDRVDEVL